MKKRLAPFLVLLEARYAPLLFAVAPQAYAVYLWLFPLPYDRTGEVFAVLGALGYELVYVGAIAWAEEDRSSIWTWATAVVALIFSVLVAHYVYREQGAWAWLHAGFPLVAFCYTLNMYSKRTHGPHTPTAQAPLQTLPERLGTFECPQVEQQAAMLETLISKTFPHDLLTNGAQALPAPFEAAVCEAPRRYACPHCQAPLASKQSLGAAVKNGYCLSCK